MTSNGLPLMGNHDLADGLASSPYFTDEEQAALAYASMALTPPERRELLNFLGWPGDLPNTHEARMLAVFERILANRGVPVLEPISETVPS